MNSFKKNFAVILSTISLALAGFSVYLGWPAADPPLGLPDDHLVSYQAAAAAYPDSFSVEDDDSGEENATKNVRLWLVSRQYTSQHKKAGDDFTCGPQQTGDCVAWGLARCIENLQAQQVYAGTTDHIVDVYRPGLYGIAKVNFSHAGPPGQGAYPDVAIKAWMAMGHIISEDDPPPYSKYTADKWGSQGTPEKFIPLMKLRAGGSAYPIRSMKELRNALVNGYPCTIAGPFKYGSSYEADGRNCLRWNGPNRGGHQMCVLGYDGSSLSGDCYFWIQNSHGAHANASVKPTTNEPPGGFWMEWDEMEKNYWPYVQCWALSHVEGFPKNNGIDWSQFDQFNN